MHNGDLSLTNSNRIQRKTFCFQMVVLTGARAPIGVDNLSVISLINDRQSPVYPRPRISRTGKVFLADHRGSSQNHAGAYGQKSRLRGLDVNITSLQMPHVWIAVAQSRMLHFSSTT